MLNPNNPYTFTDNAMEAGVAQCLPDLADANLEWAKYELTNAVPILIVPHSVNYGYRTSNYPDIIVSSSSTSVSFKVDNGTTYTPMILTFANGHTYCLTGITTLTGLTAGTNYEYIILESNIVKTGNSITINGINYPTFTATATAVDITTYNITQQYGTPSSYTTGTYSLDISASPYIPINYNGSTWATIQHAPIGEGTAASPITYAFNRRYTSPDTACVTTTNAVTTFNHNLGTQNYRTMLYLRCITAEVGYTAGQVILANAALNNTTPFFVMPYQPVVNKNSVSYRSGTFAASPYHGQNQSTGASVSFTPANWKQFVVVEGTF